MTTNDVNVRDKMITTIAKRIFLVVMLATIMTITAYYIPNYMKSPIFNYEKNILNVTMAVTQDQILNSEVVLFLPPNGEEIKLKLPSHVTEKDTIRLRNAYNGGKDDIHFKVKIKRKLPFE